MLCRQPSRSDENQEYPQFLAEIRQEHRQTGANPISVSETGAFPQCVAEIPRQARDDRKRSGSVILSLPKRLSRACRRNLRPRDSTRNRESPRDGNGIG